MRGLIMRSLAPLSYWLAYYFYRWAQGPFGYVQGTHPDAAEVGERIDYYERLLGHNPRRSKKGMVRP